MLFILTGKTASGKDTIKSALLHKYLNFRKVITTTSRSPRQNEKDGVDYFFLNKRQFEDKVNQGEFAEYVQYGGNLYGTYKKELEKALASDLIWRIDPSRAGEIRDFIRRTFQADIANRLINSVKVIYITVSDDVVLQRLRKRSLSEKEISSRMKDDAEIWQKYQNYYDFVVENVPGKLDETIDKIVNIIG